MRKSLFLLILCSLLGCTDVNLPHTSRDINDSKHKGVYIQEYTVFSGRDDLIASKLNISSIWVEYKWYFNNRLGTKIRHYEDKVLRFKLTDSIDINLFALKKIKCNAGSDIRIAGNFDLICDLKNFNPDSILQFNFISLRDSFAGDVSFQFALSPKIN